VFTPEQFSSKKLNSLALPNTLEKHHKINKLTTKFSYNITRKTEDISIEELLNTIQNQEVKINLFYQVK